MIWTKKNDKVPQRGKYEKNSSKGIILVHAHLQYVHKHSAKFQNSRLKAAGGVDYTK